MRLKLITSLMILLLILGSAAAAQDTDMPPADIANDDGGVTVVTGNLIITNPNVKTIAEDPVVILEDQAGFVDRDIDYEIPRTSQTMGVITGDFQAETEIAYELTLPIVPNAAFRDVDNDGEEDTGVQIFQVAFWNNSHNDIYIDPIEGTGWSGSYSSAIVSENPEIYMEITGGSLLVYAADDKQGFPSGFGEDGLLFTEDDPTVQLPQGYTAVSLDSDPFTFDRSSTVSFLLREPESLELNDFSEMGYAEAFDALVETFRDEYAFTEYKNIDWDALHEEFRPRFEEADANSDYTTYIFALRDFSWSIPDGHISVGDPTGTLNRDFAANVSGGLGLSLVELEDGRVIINYLTEGAPAAEAGIELGAEVTAINGSPLEAAIRETVPYSSPFSAPHTERLQQLRYVVRFPVGTEVELTYANPDQEEETITLTTIEELDSFNFSSFNRGVDRNAPPIEYRFLPSGHAYVKVNTFSGNETLIVETWEYFLERVLANGAPGIVIDLRNNGGGFSFIGRRLASYFFDEEIDLYYSETYSPYIDEFWYDPRTPNNIEPTDTPLSYSGPLAVLVAPGCASACEFFAYNFTANDRAVFVGQYPTMAIAGGWFPTLMPGGVQMAIPTTRPIDLEGNVILEGVGVVPDVRVPIDESTVFSDEDIVLNAAIEFLSSGGNNDVVNAGRLMLGDTVQGVLAPGVRLRYTFDALEAETVVDIRLGSADGQLDTVLRLLSPEGSRVLLENDDIAEGTVSSGFEALPIPEDFPIIIEVSGFNDEQSGVFSLSITEAAGE